MPDTLDPEAPPEDTDVQEPPATDASSLSGAQQPLEGGGMAAPPQQPQPGFHPLANLRAALAARQAAMPPTVSQQAQRHGGLLTGLAGVLLDGLSAGMQAQATAPLYGAPGSNFARGFTAMQNLPMQRAQQQAAMWDSLSKVEQDKATLALAEVHQKQYHMQSMRLDDAINANMMEDDYQMVSGAVADNAAEILATTSGPDARAKAWNMVRERSAQDPNGSYWMYPRGHTTDAEGRIQEVPYQVVKFNPDAPLKHDMTIAFPSTDPDGGVSMHDFTVHPPATYREFLAIRESMKAAATQALASGMKAEQKEATDRILTTDENGNAIILPRYQAAERNLNTTGKAINPQQELKLNYNKGQFSIVQSQLSQYSDAFNAVNALPEEIRQRDAKTMLSLIEESKEEGVFKGQINLPEIGSLKVPVVSSLQSALDNIFKQTQFQNMDQASQRLWRTYSQFLPNMQLYNRVVDDTARAVGMKGVVEAEQKNVPTPYDLMVNPQANAPYLDNWQNNMNLINKYVPGGMEAINEVRRQNEHTFGAPKVDISKKPPGAAGYAKGKKGWYWIDKDNKIIAPLGGTPPAQ